MQTLTVCSVFLVALSLATLISGLTTCSTCAGCGGATEILVDADVATEAFRDCTTITSVTFSANVVSIGDRSFWGTGITSVVLPDGVTSIGYNSFYLCPNLAQVSIGSGLTIIRDSAFKGGKLTKVVIPDTILTVEDDAFSDNLIECVDWKDFAGTESRVFSGNPLTGCPPTATPSVAPSAAPTVAPTTETPGGSTKSSGQADPVTDGEIAGVVIGAVVFVGLLAFGVYLALHMNQAPNGQKSSSSAQVKQYEQVKSSSVEMSSV